MQIQLSTLAIVLGALVALGNLMAVLKPELASAALKKFPRSTPLGYIFILVGTAWFVWNLKQESISDFESLKPALYALFIAVGIGTCIFVKDFIAIRGLAILFLLLAKLMVDAGRPHLGQTPWVLVIQTWAYVLVVAGIWFTISPWKLRDLLNWDVSNPTRFRTISGFRLAFGIFVVILGLKVF